MGSYTELPTENSGLFLEITEKRETLHEGSRCIVLKPSVVNKWNEDLCTFIDMSGII
jgi:hypothetical protein